MAERVPSRLLLSAETLIEDSLPDKQIHKRVKDKEDPRSGLLGMCLSWSRWMFRVGRSICPGPEQRDENGGKAE
jgi:hypothetical protein